MAVYPGLHLGIPIHEAVCFLSDGGVEGAGRSVPSLTVGVRLGNVHTEPRSGCDRPLGTLSAKEPRSSCENTVERRSANAQYLGSSFPVTAHTV